MRAKAENEVAVAMSRVARAEGEVRQQKIFAEQEHSKLVGLEEEIVALQSEVYALRNSSAK